MIAWSRPEIPRLPGKGQVPHIFDSQSQRLITAEPHDKRATLYVCGITPYDATHLGHAFTYLTYDTLLRAWRDSGIDSAYAQNVTDVDEPLFERAHETGVDWRELGAEQIALYTRDMAALRVIPPDHFISVTEAMPLIARDVAALAEQGFAYTTLARDGDAEYLDYYFDIRAAEHSHEWKIGHLAHLSVSEMVELSAERGGDPNRAGKRDPLDPCLWRAERPGEPAWESPLGRGRPGWHIECASIALHYLGTELTVQGGGADLKFPHHEMSAAHAATLSGHPLARVYSHSALVGYGGEKMSKSRGNLVFVSQLLSAGVEPDAIRLALLQHHYRRAWEWADEMSANASQLLNEWREILATRSVSGDLDPLDEESQLFLTEMRAHLSRDLDTPKMIHRLDTSIRGGHISAALIRAVADALLGIRI